MFRGVLTVGRQGHACIGLFTIMCIVSPEDPLGSGVTDGCESPCGCLDSNPNPMQVQPVLTIQPSLQFLAIQLPDCELTRLQGCSCILELWRLGGWAAGTSNMR